MDPFTLAAGIGAAGKLFGGLMGFGAGNAQAKAEEVAATEAKQQAGVNAQLALQQGDRTAAHAAVQGAANGGGLTGSTMGVIQDLSDQSVYNARQATYRGVTQANDDLYDASVAKGNGLNSLISGGLGAAGSLVGGMMQSTQNQNYVSILNKLRGLGQSPDIGYDYATMGA